MEKKAHRGGLWKVFGSGQFLRGMWEYFSLKRVGARKYLADGAREKQEGKQGQEQDEPPFKEVLEQIKRSADIHIAVSKPCAVPTSQWSMAIGRIFKEEYRKDGKFCEWTFERIREAYEKVAMDDIGRLGTAQEI